MSATKAYHQRMSIPPPDNDGALPPAKKRCKRARKVASLGDVAKLAGVSPQTASRVSTGSDLVTARTEAKVRAAMDQLGYVPNQAARALRQGKYRAIGVVTQQLERSGESLTTAGIVASAAEQGYSVTVTQISDPDSPKIEESLALLARLPIDGLIVVRMGQVAVDQVVFPENLPVVACDSKLAGMYPMAIGDQSQGVRDLMEYLMGLGHRVIHHVSGPLDSHSTFVRRDSWAQVLTDAGLSEGKVWVGDWTMASGYEAGLEISNDPEVTAVFCANDEMAFGVMRALEEVGIRVPEDVSVAGFDGGDLSRFADPPLTTVRQDFKSIASLAVERLIDQISGREHALEPQFAPVELLIRNSTASPSPGRLRVSMGSP